MPTARAPHVALLTGGGDCPGLNAVIRAVTLALKRACGARITGIERGFHGLVARRVRELAEPDVAGILAEGGTILGTHNRCDPFRWEGQDHSTAIMAFARELGIDALVAIGGDGTMRLAERFSQLGLPVVGVPKTIDNDLRGTDRCFGFDSAVAVVAEALDRLATTARSHGRVMILETMGRDAGWIALEGGLAGGADAILIPELPFSLHAVVELARERERVGGSLLVCIAEGARIGGERPVVRGQVGHVWAPVRLGGVGQVLQHRLQPLLSCEVRSTLLGHVQRGGTPTAFDRVLATRYGVHAAELVASGRCGRMVALQGDRVTSVPLADVAGGSRPVPADHELLRAARGTGVLLG
ncbi:MAG: ATP-dependent 6-phosphofructokinase [Rubrivivax sp.]|nr:ATP-dependent 6-phosphofructokinase [Rubrivivax sp.]